jgi:ABC-2 type transport system permease protein
MAITATPNARLAALPPASGQAGLRGAIACEFTKIRSVRSTYWTLGALFLVSVGLGVLISWAAGSSFAGNPGNEALFDATQT